jgi:hypothetical protein
MIAEKIQLKALRPIKGDVASAPRAGFFEPSSSHKLFHRDKMPIQNNFHSSDEKPVN